MNRLILSALLAALAVIASPTAIAAPDCSGYSSSQGLQWPETNPVWEFCWRRAQNSQPQPDGSGLELFDVRYNGHLVFARANVPVLNVEYGPGGCGCFRDWLDNDRRFEASGSPCGGGFCQADEPVTTICDCAPGNTCDSNPDNACNVDIGSFVGVAAHSTQETLELTTQTSAGWYRYEMSWRFHLDGTIEPTFGFGATQNGCTDTSHFHHGYYRFDFDIDGPANDRVSEAFGELTDSDGDGLLDAGDNCINTANPNQIDSNGDGFGNLCDADLNNDNAVNLVDLIAFKAAFFGSDADADFNSDGSVNLADLVLLKGLFGVKPGPSGVVEGGLNLYAGETGDYAQAGQSWLVEDAVTGRGYAIHPGSSDHKLTADTFNPVAFAKGDYWVLKERSSELDDGINYGSGCAIDLSDYTNGENIDTEDVVFWYRQGVHHIGLDECFCGRQGPTLVPVGDWSP